MGSRAKQEAVFDYPDKRCVTVSGQGGRAYGS